MPTTREYIQQQLRPAPAGQPPSYLDVCEMIRQAGLEAAAAHGAGSPEARGLRAQYGQAISRGWRAWLVELLTEHAAAHPDQATRERVRSWQRSTFGHACSSQALARWARPGAGDRGADTWTTSELTAEARELYQVYAVAMGPAAAAR